MNWVIFPSAKIVTQDLQNVGKLPAIIYPIDQMQMFDLFYKYYFDEIHMASRFEVVTYEAHSQVVRKIGSKPEVCIHKLDILKDIGYTVYYGMCKANITEDDSVVINFADIADLRYLPPIIEDRCYFAKGDISPKWTYFEERGGRIKAYYEKPKRISDARSNKILIGIFHIKYASEFQAILKDAVLKPTDIDSLWIALQRYSELHPFDMLESQDWFDIGHVDRYYDTQVAIKSRTFNHITIDKNRGILTKTSDDKEKFIGEIQWYLKLPLELEYARPRIFSYSLNYNSPYVSMEYYSYHTLHELFLYGALTDEQWCNIFRRIRYVLNDFKTYSVKGNGVRSSLEDMYIDKTLNRLNAMRKVTDYPDFEKEVCINGQTYLSCNEILHRLPLIIKEKLLNIDELHIIHGDLCFSNIMIDSNYSFIKMIDPRGSFGKYDIYGDIRYELAKLMHSIDGKYDYIIKDLFEIEYNGNLIDFKVLYDQDVDIEDCFERIFEEEMEVGKEQIKLIEAILFFSMIPLHKENKRQQVAMLATAYQCLNQVIDITSNRR